MYWLVILLLLPALAVPCGTPCDKQGVPGIITLEGVCVPVEESCSINDFYWSSAESSTSSMKFYGNVNCICGETADCNITMNSHIYNVTSDILASGHSITPSSTPPLNLTYGTNTVSLGCFCVNTNTSCSYGATDVIVNAELLQVSTDSLISPGHTYTSSIKLKNLGNIRSDYLVEDTIYELDNCSAGLGPVLSGTSNSSTVSIDPAGEPGDTKTIEFIRNSTCSYTGSAKHQVNFCVQSVGCPKYNGNGGCFDIYECYDYAGSWPPNQDCAFCQGGTANDYSCTQFHCCPANQHWENGVCCELGQKCCLQNSECPQAFRCDLGNNYCVTLADVGFTCQANSDCRTNLHCDANSTLTNYTGIGYCTYNTTADAGIGDNCWDEGTGSLPPFEEEGCDGCSTSWDCPAGYYCDSAYALCRDCPSGEGSQDGVCKGAPTFNCFNLDRDCCENDANCTSLGPGYFCDTGSKVCRICEIRQDYWCPSPVCFGIDPDCCKEGTACLVGTVCGPGGSCLPQAGKECITPSDCGAGNMLCEYSNCFKKKVCVTPSFVRIQPSLLPKPIDVGTEVSLNLVLTNPQGCPSQFKLSFSGPAKYFARFADRQTEQTISLESAEVKVIPIKFSSANVGKYTLVVNVVDLENPELSGSTNIQIQVQGTTSKGAEAMVVAPEFGIIEIIGLLGFAALVRVLL